MNKSTIKGLAPGQTLDDLVVLMHVRGMLLGQNDSEHTF